MRISIALSTDAAEPAPQTVNVWLTPSELHIVVLQHERDAAEAARDGHHHAAETLAWRAACLREAGRKC